MSITLGIFAVPVVFFAFAFVYFGYIVVILPLPPPSFQKKVLNILLITSVFHIEIFHVYVLLCTIPPFFEKNVMVIQSYLVIHHGDRIAQVGKPRHKLLFTHQKCLTIFKYGFYIWMVSKNLSTAPKYYLYVHGLLSVSKRIEYSKR